MRTDCGSVLSTPICSASATIWNSPSMILNCWAVTKGASVKSMMREKVQATTVAAHWRNDARGLGFDPGVERQFSTGIDRGNVQANLAARDSDVAVRKLILADGLLATVVGFRVLVANATPPCPI